MTMLRNSVALAAVPYRADPRHGTARFIEPLFGNYTNQRHGRHGPARSESLIYSVEIAVCRPCRPCRTLDKTWKYVGKGAFYLHLIDSIAKGRHTRHGRHGE